MAQQFSPLRGRGSRPGEYFKVLPNFSRQKAGDRVQIMLLKPAEQMLILVG